MTNNLQGLLPQRKLGPIIVFGILLVVGMYQISLLVAQFSPYFPNINASLNGYFRYITIMAYFIGVTILIWIEINNLEEFHVDQFALITAILGSVLRPRIGIVGEDYFSGLVILSGISMMVVWIIKKPVVPRTNRRWTLAGIIVGCISAILIAFLGFYLHLNLFPSHLLQNRIFPTIVGLIFRQFSDGVAYEEILFRGFLWGYLRRLGWEESRVFWTQGLLFWFLHFSSLLARPFTFFLAIPFGTLIDSKLRSSSKQIYPSILSHTITNIVGGLFNLAIY